MCWRSMVHEFHRLSQAIFQGRYSIEKISADWGTSLWDCDGPGRANPYKRPNIARMVLVSVWRWYALCKWGHFLMVGLCFLIVLIMTKQSKLLGLFVHILDYCVKKAKKKKKKKVRKPNKAAMWTRKFKKKIPLCSFFISFIWKYNISGQCQSAAI